MKLWWLAALTASVSTTSVEALREQLHYSEGFGESEDSAHRASQIADEKQTGCIVTCHKPYSVDDDGLGGEDEGLDIAPHLNRGHFELEGAEVRKIVARLRTGSKYAVMSSSDCGGPELGRAIVVPWPHAQDPINRSRVHIFLEPDAQDQLRDGSKGWICRKDLNGSVLQEPDSCLCALQTVTTQLRLRSLLARLAGAIPGGIGLFKSVEDLQDRCPSLLILDGAEGILLAGTIAVVLVLVDCYVSLPRRHEQAAESGGSAAKPNHLKAALIIPSPWSTFKKGASQGLAFAMLVTSIAYAAVNLTLKVAWEGVIWFAILWGITFGLVGAYRILSTLCLRQLSHATMTHGTCLTEPTSLQRFDMLTAAGILLLFSCVLLAQTLQDRCSLSGILTTFALAVVSFMGPAWSVWKNIKAAQEHDEQLGKLQGTVQLPALATLFSRGRTGTEEEMEVMKQSALGSSMLFDGQNSAELLESRLVTSDLRLLPLSKIVEAGREDADLLEVLASAGSQQPHEYIAASGAATQTPQPVSAAPAISFNLFRDLGWYRRAIYDLTGSRSAYLLLPVLVSMCGLLVASSVLQGVQYSCTLGELKRLEVAVDEKLKFFPWRHKYFVNLDPSFTEAFLYTAARSSRNKWIKIKTRERPDREVSWSGSQMASVGLINSPLPRVATVEVQGLRGKARNYKVQFRPAGTMPSSIRFSHASGFSRCMPWSDVYARQVSIPDAFGDQIDDLAQNRINVSISLVDYAMGIPMPHGEELDNDNISMWTAFTPLNASRHSMPQSCRDLCKSDAQCLRAFAGETGCFMAMHRLMDDDMCAQQHTNAKGNVEWRHWLLQHREVSGQVYSSCRSCEDEGLAGPIAGEWRLQFNDVSLSWAQNMWSEVNVRLHLAIGSQRLDSAAEKLTLRRGRPVPFQVLVALHGYEKDGNISLMNTTGQISVTGDIEVIISKYNPRLLGPSYPLKLTIVPLLSDDRFHIHWPEHQLAQPSNSADNLHFEECSADVVKNRYAICKHGGRWESQPASFRMSGWDASPSDEVFFEVRPNDPAEALLWEEPRHHTVEVRLEGDAQEPVEWALDDDGARRECLASKAEGEVWSAMLRSPSTLCKLIHSGCTWLGGMRQNHIELKNIGDAMTEAMLPLSLRPSGAVQLLECMQQLDETPAWASPGNMKLCEGSYDVVCIKVKQKTGDASIVRIPLKMFLRHDSTHNALDASAPSAAAPLQNKRIDSMWCRVCRELLTNAASDLKQGIGMTARLEDAVMEMLTQAVKTAQVATLNRTLACLKDMHRMPSSRHIFDKIAKAMWSLSQEGKSIMNILPVILGMGGDMQRRLVYRMVSTGCQVCLRELSSQNLDQVQHVNFKFHSTQQMAVGLRAILHLPSLQEVYLNAEPCAGCGDALTTPQVGAEMWKAMGALRGIPSFVVQGLDLTAAGSEFAKALSHMTALRLLVIRDVRIQGEALCEGLAHIPNVQQFDWSYNGQMDVTSARSFAEVLGKWTDMKWLQLQKHDLNDEGLAEISKGLVRLTSLEVLDLSENRINHEAKEGAESLAMLAKAIEAMPNLTTLKLRDNWLGGWVNDDPLKEVLLSSPHLEHLDLSHNRINSSRALEVLANQSALKHLHLGQNFLKDDEMLRLVKVLPSLSGLQTLRLNRVQIRDTGIIALSEVLTSFPMLTDLSVGWNNFGDEGAAALAKGIAAISTRSLITVDLGKCGFHLAGLQELLEALKLHTGLRVLRLESNDHDIYTQPGVRLIVEAMAHWPHLQELSVYLVNSFPVKNLVEITRDEVAGLRFNRWLSGLSKHYLQ